MPSVCWAATTTLVASKDNSIFANNVDNSNGGGAGVFVGTTNSMQNNSIRRGLLEFNIASAVPAGATITEVNLTMYLGQASLASGMRTIDLHRLTADWGEGTAGNTTTSIARHRHRLPPSPATPPGTSGSTSRTAGPRRARKATIFRQSVRAPTSGRHSTRPTNGPRRRPSSVMCKAGSTNRRPTTAGS